MRVKFNKTADDDSEQSSPIWLQVSGEFHQIFDVLRVSAGVRRHGVGQALLGVL